jgi:hypothetical protein
MTVDTSRSHATTGKVLWHLMTSLDGFDERHQ